MPRILLAALLALVASPALSAGAAQWQTSYGTLSLPAITGNLPIYAPYPEGGGRIKGEMRLVEGQPVIIGHWVQHEAARRCATSVDGSRHWGNVTLYFDKEFSRFQGGWDYCGTGEIRGDWTGRLHGKATGRASEHLAR